MIVFSKDIKKINIKVRNESEWVSCCNMLYSHGYHWNVESDFMEIYSECLETAKEYIKTYAINDGIYLVVYNDNSGRLYYNYKYKTDGIINLDWYDGMDLHEINEANKLGLI